MQVRSLRATVGRAVFRRAAATSALVAVLSCTAACSGSGQAGAPEAKGAASLAQNSPSPSEAPRDPDLPEVKLPQGSKQDFREITVAGNTMKWDYLNGKESGVKLKVFVWTPPQYDDPANKDKKFPVLFLYPGGEGATYNTWVDDSAFGAMELIKQGKTHPFILVMPYMQVKTNLDTECMDLPGQPKVGTFMDTDLPAMVLANFRALPPGKAWGASGDSSGAWCATSLGVRHPEIFNTVVSLGGYFEIQTPLKGGKDPAVVAQDPQKLVAGPNPPKMNILAMAGTKAGPDVALAKKFKAAAKPPTNVELLIQEGGTHTLKSFRKIIPESFDFFAKHMTNMQ